MEELVRSSDMSVSSHDEYLGAIEDWKCDSENINNFFVHNRTAPILTDTVHTIKNLLEMMLIIDNDIIVYRNIRGVIDDFVSGDILDAHRRFTSTSTDRELIDEFGTNLMVITLPVGTRCIYIDKAKNFFKNIDLHEIVLPPGIFVCTHIESDIKYFMFIQDKYQVYY